MKFKTQLVTNNHLNSYTRLLVFRLLSPTDIDFKAGQFMLIEVAPQITRAYSIINPSYLKNQLEFIIDVRPGGPGSLFAKRIKPDDKVNIKGPFGKFILNSNNHPKVFISTGCGVASMKSMIDTLFYKNPQAEVGLFWGMRHLEDAYFFSYFQSLSKKHPNFSFNLCLSKASVQDKKRPHIFPGHVTQAIRLDSINKQTDYYLCGGSQPVQKIKEILINGGVLDKNIISEGYY